MDTFQLINELIRKPKNEIEYGLIKLMLKDKIDFTDISKAYVNYLNIINNDQLNKLTEAETCIMESFFYGNKNQSEESKNSIQRRLYFLNQSGRLNMTTLNEKYNYNENEAKELSWYERIKKNFKNYEY